MRATHQLHDFELNETVTFDYCGRELSGLLAQLNPRRALVVCDDGQEFTVPYAELRPVGWREVSARRDQAEVEALAVQLLQQYDLANWSFEFDYAKLRAGACHFATKKITMAREFACTAPEGEIRDTLLHEIAHALVGPRHSHGSVWQAKAREIGCSTARCHDFAFSQPRYIVSCSNGCFTATANRRRRRVVCRTCEGAIEYQTFTLKRWQQHGSGNKDETPS